MKRILLMIMLLPGLIQAQVTSGRILYEETIEFKINFGGDADEELLANLPSNKKDYSELLFTPDQSLYRATEGPEKPTGEAMSFTADNGANIEIVTKKSTNESHLDVEKQLLTQKLDFMSRTFLIEDDLSGLAWKLGSETKEILGYPCTKATYMKDSIEHEAWFTTSIPVSIGPSQFVGLPGAILELSVDNGQRTYKAIELDTQQDYSKDILPPKKGKKVTRAEFDEIKAEKMKEMELEYGPAQGGGNVKVFIQKN